jgi:hypothetical protein
MDVSAAQAARLSGPAAALAMPGPTFVTNRGERKGGKKCYSGALSRSTRSV